MLLYASSVVYLQISEISQPSDVHFLRNKRNTYELFMKCNMYATVCKRRMKCSLKFIEGFHEVSIRFKRAFQMLHFSSTDSAVDIEGNFENKLKKRKRKKQSNLSLNQSRNKKGKFNYGQQVKLCKAGDEAEGTSPDPVATAVDETHTEKSSECTHGLKIHGSPSDIAQKLLEPATGANTSSDSKDISVDVYLMVYRKNQMRMLGHLFVTVLINVRKFLSRMS